MGAGIPSLPPPVFVNDADGLDPNLILADMVAEFEAAAGRTLYPAQVERLLINLYAYRESLVRNAIQYAAEQNLLAFATFPMLDYLGQLLSVTRLASQPAVTTLQFTLAGALTVPFTIAAGTLAGTNDGQFAFATSTTITIAAGATVGSVAASATAPGAAANGYLAGQVSVQLNPNALIASVTNTSTTTGGSAPETDDHLRTRIQAAPNQFSVAGPVGAYRFFAIGADPSIVDAQIISPAPGSVNAYILTGPVTMQPAPAPNSAGVANSALLAKVAAVLSADTVRPLTDTVNVLAVDRGGLPDHRHRDALLGCGSDRDYHRRDGGRAGTCTRAGRQDSARHRAEPDNRRAVGGRRLRRRAHVADTDAAHGRAMGELHDDLADDGVQRGA